jgi:transposase
MPGEIIDMQALHHQDDRVTALVVHPNQITQWKRQAVENLAKAFDDKASDAQAGREAEVTKLHAKIGQLVVERDFLAKAFDR